MATRSASAVRPAASELILLPQALVFESENVNSDRPDSSERLFADGNEIHVDGDAIARPERMEQLLADATARTLAHSLSWWFVNLSKGLVPIVQYAAQSARLRASGVRIAVYTTRSHAPGNRRSIFVALDADLTHRTRFDVLLSYILSSGLPYAKPYTALRADGRLQFSLISHAHSLLSKRTLANLTATRRASARFRGPCRLLSLGDAGRAHTLSIRAAHALGVPVRVVGGTHETLDVDAARSECAALGSACRWDRARMGQVDFFREIEKPDVCAVSIPFINESAIKIGIGITTAIQAAARGVPVITLDYAHFRGHLKDGCNAVLVNTSAVLSGSASQSERMAHAAAGYTNALRHVVGRREKLFECSAKRAAFVTIEQVAKEVNRTLAHVPPWTASFSFFRPPLLQLVNNLKDLYERVQTAAVAMPWDVVVGAVGLHAAVFGVLALVVAAVVSWRRGARTAACDRTRSRLARYARTGSAALPLLSMPD